MSLGAIKKRTNKVQSAIRKAEKIITKKNEEKKAANTLANSQKKLATLRKRLRK